MPDSTNQTQIDLSKALREIEQLRTLLRQAEEQKLHRRKSIDQKLKEFARELRVPLTSVLGFTDLLSVTHKGNPTELNQIAIAGHQLMKLVSTLEDESLLNIPEPPAATEVLEAEPAPAEPEREIVLHVEDNESNFRLVERILAERPEISMEWAENGELGLTKASQHLPSLILLDLNLPDMHGSDLLRQLKSNPLTKDVPVIVVSADISPTQIERMLQAGASNYLTKPFEIKRLLCLVDEGLRHTTKLAA